MPAPPSYIDITSLPFSVTVPQADFNGGTYGGVADETWLRYVSAGNIVLGISINSGGTFTPNANLFQSDGTTSITSSNRPFYAYLDANTVYYRVRRNGGGSSDFDFTVDVTEGALLSAIPPDAFVINDDSQITGTDPHSGEPFPATVWQTDGTFLGFYPSVPAGEIGDSLPNGISLWHDRFGSFGTAGTLVLLDNTLTQIAAGISIGVTAGVFPCITNDGSKFYVLNRNTLALYTVDATGAVTGPIATLGGGADYPYAIGVNAAGTILYHAHGYTNGNIGHWDLVGNSELGTFYSVPGFTGGFNDYVGLTALNNHPGEILVLSDDSIVFSFYDVSADQYHVNHVSSGGTLIDDITYSGSGPTGIGIDHFSRSPNDPTHVYLWLFIDGVSGNEGKFGDLELATGTITPFFTSVLWSAGIPLKATSSPFGPSASCTMVTLGLAVAGTPTPTPGPIPPPLPPNPNACPPCGNGNPPAGGNPNPIGTLPPWVASCTDGGVVDSVADLADGEDWAA